MGEYRGAALAMRGARGVKWGRSVLMRLGRERVPARIEDSTTVEIV